MNMEIPDKWVVLKITAPDYLLYKVLATWYGGYLSSDSWRLNSGIKETEIPLEDTYIDFIGHSGSVYRCQDGCYGTSFYTQGILNNMTEVAKTKDVIIEVMDENTDWSNLKY